MTVNLCFAYDSIDEINTAIQKSQKDSDPSNQINFGEVYKNLMITRPVDILVRTSNESRLSNFMLMQNGYSLMCILK
jgi:undecaprenyl diphosphate synthase